MSQEKPLEIMSFGGGVQTVAMALMALNGDLPMPDHAIFSDPGWEVEDTYAYLSWFIPYCEERGMKFHVVENGDIRKLTVTPGKRWVTMPFFSKNEDGRKGMLMRQCTSEFKIVPVYKTVRKVMGLKPRQRTKNPCNLWLGISIDEVTRMKPSRVGYVTNAFPFIDNNISRANCLAYIDKCGLPLPPKSACIGCPYHSDIFWQNLKNNRPKEFEDACDFDRNIRHIKRKGLQNEMFLHSLMKPLSEIDFTQGQVDLFENECEGYCGL